MPARVRSPAPAKVPIDISVPDLARACEWTRWKALRRLQNAGVVLRRKGTGTLRSHYWVTIADLRATPDGEAIFESIQWHRLLVARLEPPAGGAGAEGDEDEDYDDDRDQGPPPTRGRDGVWR